MTARLNPMEVDPKLMHAMFGLAAPVAQSGLEKSLIDLIYFRVSQINGCAYCLDMHSKTCGRRVKLSSDFTCSRLGAKRPLFGARACGMAWAEAVTLLINKEVPDDVYEQAIAQFSKQELAALTLAVVAINGWNRLNIAFRTEAGGYQPGMFKSMAQAKG